MRKMIRKMAAVCTLLLLMIGMVTQPVFAQVSETRENEETGYEMVIQDEAGLLDENGSEVDELWQQMEQITAYGNVAFYTTNENSDSTDYLAKSVYRDLFGTESGTIFVIDMENRELYIFSDGAINRTISRSIALTITDNVYRQASAGDYAACAKEAFSEIAVKLEGGRIAAPMRYLSALFFAMLAALMITFIIAKYSNSTAMAAEEEFVKSLHIRQALDNGKKELIKRDIKFRHSDESGSSGGGGGGFGGGFGGSSGSGGGHGF